MSLCVIRVCVCYSSWFSSISLFSTPLLFSFPPKQTTHIHTHSHTNWLAFTMILKGNPLLGVSSLLRMINIWEWQESIFLILGGGSRKSQNRVDKLAICTNNLKASPWQHKPLWGLPIYFHVSDSLQCFATLGYQEDRNAGNPLFFLILIINVSN